MVQEAHIVIKLTAISAEQEPHSTIAAFLINPAGDCHWIHAGDSRIYHFHGGQLVKRTLRPLLRADAGRPRRAHRGRSQRPPAVQHPDGLPGRRGRSAGHAALHRRSCEPGDVLMACSDGVWHYFSAEELGSVLSSLSPREATEFLIEKARSRGARRRRQPVAGDRQARAAADELTARRRAGQRRRARSGLARRHCGRRRRRWSRSALRLSSCLALARLGVLLRLASALRPRRSARCLSSTRAALGCCGCLGPGAQAGAASAARCSRACCAWPAQRRSTRVAGCRRAPAARAVFFVDLLQALGRRAALALGVVERQLLAAQVGQLSRALARGCRSGSR